jgi:hypothetical protein
VRCVISEAMNGARRWRQLQIDHTCGDPVSQWRQELGAVPSRPGVYIWRLRFGVGLDHLNDGPSFYDALEDELRLPIGSLPEVAVRPSFRHGPARVGGGNLHDQKRDFLRQSFSKPAAIQQMLLYISDLDRFASPIYVGSSMQLRERLVEHVEDRTELVPYVRDELGRSLTQVSLSYWVLPEPLATNPDNASKLVKCVEMIAQILLAPHAVKRQG